MASIAGRAGRLLLTLLLLPTLAFAQDPEAYDPVLDVPPTPRPPQPMVEHDPRSPGFTISGHMGLYAGAVRSFLVDELSTLEKTARFNIGFGFGYRTRSFIELGLDIDLGMGQTYDSEFETTVFAFDVLVEPRILGHFYEGESFGAYGGLGSYIILFDVEEAGLNQAGLGPAGLLGILLRLDRHSLLYVEAGASYFYDLLAFHFEDPSEEDLIENPFAEPTKVEGAWFPIFRVTAGYRLTAF